MSFGTLVCCVSGIGLLQAVKFIASYCNATENTENTVRSTYVMAEGRDST